MEEKTAIIGVLLITAIAATLFLVAENSNSGAAVVNNYQICNCQFIVGNQLFERQVQSNVPNCDIACFRYADNGELVIQGEY